MYDPITGRWLTQDPLGFEAGDSNLYRYVGNDPTNETDPSGLASINQLNFKMPGFKSAEQRAIMDAMWLAVEKLEKALIMLEDHWDELKDLSTFTPLGGKPFVSLRYRLLAKEYLFPYGGWGVSGVSKTTGRKEYITLIKQVLDPLRKSSHRTNFMPDRSPPTPNGRKAYIRTLPLYIIPEITGSTIHITNLFFETDPLKQIDILVHELGRRIGLLEENTGSFFNDVYEWDNTIEYLANKYDELMSKKK